MTTKHTPGPWTADENGLITAGRSRLHIAQAATTGLGHAAAANAQLIAAAPDLLQLATVAMLALGVLANDAKEAGHPERSKNAAALADQIQKTIIKAGA